MGHDDITFSLNGTTQRLAPAPGETVVDVVRERCGLTGTKLVCGAGACGACTVLVNGSPVVSCLMPAQALDGSQVTTIEGVARGDVLHTVQRAFMAHDALQCGFCTPGFVVEAVAFVERWRAVHGPTTPGREQVAAAMAGHLCRCGAYEGITRAVQAACTGSLAPEGEATDARVDARAKVTGAARYTVDVRHEGQLEGAVVRSPHAHARVASIDLGAARAMRGVSAVALVDAGKVVRHVGQAVAAVAAPDHATLRAAREAVRVTWEVLPAVLGAAQARVPGAPLVHGGLRRDAVNGAEGPVLPAPWSGNVRGPSRSFGDRPRRARAAIAAARARGDPGLVSGTFRTGAQSHTSFEPHAAVACFDGERLVVHLSTQAVGPMARKVARLAGLPEDRVQVIAEHVGGGFGSKLALGDEAVAAVRLARECRRPVRVVLSREEELTVTGYRPATQVDVALLPAADGSLEALSIHAWADAGVAINSTIAALGRLIYRAGAKDLADYDVVSHLPPGSPFRGPGGPALCFALEQAVDEAARRLGVDPITLRQRWDPEPNRQRLYQWAAGVPAWRDRPTGARPGDRLVRGVGVAAANWLYWYEPGMKVQVGVGDGRLVVRTGTQDMGTGIRTVLARVVATAFAVSPSEVDVRVGDSTLPEGPLSGGSRTTATLVPAVLTACEALKRHLGPLATGETWAQRVARVEQAVVVEAARTPDHASQHPEVVSPLAQAGIMGVGFDYVLRMSTGLRTGRGAPSAVIVSEVEVDRWLGQVQVRRVHAGLAVGRIYAPRQARSQVCGAIIQGIGHALHEARVHDPVSGITLTAGLEDYRIPGIAETPEMDVHFDEEGFGHVAGGGVGLGEVSALAIAASIANAVHDATGVRVREAPMRPERLVLHLGEDAP